MSETETATLDPAVSTASPATASPGQQSAGEPAAPPPPSLRERAVKTAQTMVAEDDAAKGVAPRRPRGTRAGTASPPGATPSSGRPAGGAATVAEAAAPLETSQRVGDPLTTLSGFADHLPPEQRAAFTEALAPVEQYVGDVQAWATGIQQHAETIAAQRDQMERIAANPQFQQALAMVKRGQNGDADPRGGGPPTNGEARLPREEDCETEAERHLVRVARQQQAANQQLEQRLQRMEGGMEERSAQERQERQTQYASEIGAAHHELDANFPELAASPQTRRAWHEQAVELLEVQSRRGGRLDVKKALLDAAKLMTYDSAQTTGAQRALEDARRAGRNSTFRDTAAAPDTSGPRTGETLRDLAKRMPGADKFQLGR